MRILVVFILFLFFFLPPVFAQIQLGGTGDINSITYDNPKKFEVGGIVVSGTQFLDKSAIVLLSGVSVGDKITVPGDDIAKIINNLWKQKLFSDIKVYANSIQGNKIFLEIKIVELPRLSRFKFSGISKNEADNIRDEINLYKEKIVNENLINTTKNTIENYFIEKGFLNVEVDIKQQKDSAFYNHVLLSIDINKNKKVKIKSIHVHGNESLEDWQIRMAMKETKRKTKFTPFSAFDTLIFSSIKNIVKLNFIELRDDFITYASDNLRISIMKSSKFIEENYEKDKRIIEAKYNAKGFRDARVEKDTIIKEGKDIVISLHVNEGKQYYFRNIEWLGNSKYTSKQLSDILGIKKGDVYNQEMLETRLYMNQDGRDISSLYMDDGYLFFQITPVEVMVENDSIDFEMRIYEGQQARINRVLVMGNTKTNDHVIMREIRTRPGELFSRSDIIRTQRELAQLGYFNAETLNVNPKPNPVDGSVDIEYIVEEKSSDMIELSGGWGAGRLVGTLGVSFSNFSTKNLFKTSSWQPLPAGDGQRLSVRAQSNGTFFQSYNASFTEPWLGGKRPNALSVSAYRSVQSNGQTKWLKEDRIFVKDTLGNKVINPNRSSVTISGISVGLGRRLSWPDDYFMLYQEINFQHFQMDKWTQFLFSDGQANNLFYRINITRSSVDQPIYPRLGSEFTISLQITPPYSLFNNIDYKDKAISNQEKYKWIEYHKWKFTSNWYTKIVGDLVLRTNVGFGYIGSYNRDLGTSPLERFYLGGSGLTGWNLDGREIIALRGYDDNAVSARTGASIINKYIFELRYPFSLNPSATIYGLGFFEAGNTWNNVVDFNPFNVKRSAGLGVRVFLPMFGLLGLDYGWRFDDVPTMENLGTKGAKRGQLHFTIGANLGQL
jgi:outer membrane protein insertion porin family